MSILDFFFKMYFSFFRNLGKPGAGIAVNMLMPPLSLNMYTLFLVGMSYFIRIGDMGGVLFVFGLLVTGVITLLLLRRIYIVKERHTLIKINYPAFYYLSALFHTIASAVIFTVGAYLVLS